MKPPVSNFKEYIRPFDRAIQERLITIQETIQKAAPGAESIISYSMPAFKFHGRLVYFAAFKNHIGFYPMASGIRAFQKEIEKAGYKWAKGSVQFPHDEPLPLPFITKMIKYRVKDNLEKEMGKVKNQSKK